MSWNETIQGYLQRKESHADVRICNCIGPQDGQPVCPCAMRNVKVKDGRYVQVIDLGPAPKGAA